MKKCHAIYEAANNKNPERWTGPIRNWEPENIVYLNPGKPAASGEELKEKAAFKKKFAERTVAAAKG